MVLLQGRARSEARAVLGTLSTRYLRLRPSEVADLSLADGLAGVALAHAALHQVFPAAGHLDRVQRTLDRALERLATEHLDPGLHLGVAGLGWVMLHLLDPADRAQQADLFAPIDRALGAMVADPTWSRRFDLITGITGIGVYALERLPDAAGATLVAAIVARLAESSRRQPIGVAWWTDPTWSSCAVERPPHQDFALGVAHGAAGVIAFLGRVLAAEVDSATRATARALLGDAVAWLLSHERAAGFAVHAVPDPLHRPTRIAWCVGDLGIAAALASAGRTARNASWRRAAIRIGLRAGSRSEQPVERAQVVDAGLCHGTAGIAHGFHRLFLATGDDDFAAAARRWFARTLAIRTRRGFAGFRSHEPDRTHQLAWRSSPGFLTGGAGITLALVAAISATEPAWDRSLLLS